MTKENKTIVHITQAKRYVYTSDNDRNYNDHHHHHGVHAEDILALPSSSSRASDDTPPMRRHNRNNHHRVRHHDQQRIKAKKIKRKKSIYEKPINAIWELFSDYSDTSTIHGFRYLGEKRRHWLEKVWWIIAVVLSLGVCGKLILDIWHKWQYFPVIVTFAEKSTPVWEIPFPSVTICPETRIKQSKFNYTNIVFKSISNQTQEEYEMFQSTIHICKYLPFKHEILRKGGDSLDETVYQTLQNLAPSVTDLMYRCEWIGAKKQCTNLFYPIWTEEGLCYSFNMLNSNDLYKEERVSDNLTTHLHSSKYWNTDKMYLPNMPDNETFPYRVFGASDGMTIHLQQNAKDIDYLCGGAVEGFKLLMHTPGEIPQISKYYYRIPMAHETIVSVKPILMKTAESLDHYPAERRQCFLESERRLKFFKVYTQRNCELECIANQTLRKCKCVGFTMPRTKDTRICGISHKKCYDDVEFKVAKKVSKKTIRGCNCLPACASITYDAELSFAKYNLTEYMNARKVHFHHRQQYAKIFISFKENQIFASRRSELFGGVDFLASCGGLLGLFMGFSMLSIVEMIYYCTLRLACNLRRRRARKRQRLDQLNNVEDDFVDAPPQYLPQNYDDENGDGDGEEQNVTTIEKDHRY